MKRSYSAYLSGAIVGLVTLGLMATPAKAGNLQDWGQRRGIADRFALVLDDEAYLDQETQLVWERSPSVALFDWFFAGQVCANKFVGGVKGWKLPSVHQLSSLLTDEQFCTPDTALPCGHPFLFVQEQADYWTSTQFADFDFDGDGLLDGAWFVGLGDGFISGDFKTARHHIWCVRSGQSGPDEY